MKVLLNTQSIKLVACWTICFFVVCDFFFLLNFFKKSFRITISVKQFGSRSGPTFCRAWSGSKLFAKIISIRQKSPQARKELNAKKIDMMVYQIHCMGGGYKNVNPLLHIKKVKFLVTSKSSVLAY